MRTITTCPGIGDSIWLMQKLVNCNERFHFCIPDGPPQRGHQLFELLPNIAESCTYAPGLNYRKVNDQNVTRAWERWHQITLQQFFLSANNHLEEGRRIETFLPDLKTSYKLEYHTGEQDKAVAAKLLPDGPSYIGLYTSAYSNARHWNGWQADDWMELVRGLPGFTFVIIGAPYDVLLPDQIMRGMDDLGISYVNTIGQPLSTVVEILKRQRYFIGFPSGLSILNETLGKDGTMFYPTHLKPMINTWADPERIASGKYKGCVFPEPADLLTWLKKEYKIFETVK